MKVSADRAPIEERWMLTFVCMYDDEDWGHASHMYLNRSQITRLIDDRVTLGQVLDWILGSEVKPDWLPPD
jgi:hypothetical protein